MEKPDNLDDFYEIANANMIDLQIVFLIEKYFLNAVGWKIILETPQALAAELLKVIWLGSSSEEHLATSVLSQFCEIMSFININHSVLIQFDFFVWTFAILQFIFTGSNLSQESDNLNKILNSIIEMGYDNLPELIKCYESLNELCDKSLTCSELEADIQSETTMIQTPQHSNFQSTNEFEYWEFESEPKVDANYEMQQEKMTDFITEQRAWDTTILDAVNSKFKQLRTYQMNSTMKLHKVCLKKERKFYFYKVKSSRFSCIIFRVRLLRLKYFTSCNPLEMAYNCLNNIISASSIDLKHIRLISFIKKKQRAKAKNKCSTKRKLVYKPRSIYDSQKFSFILQMSRYQANFSVLCDKLL